MSRDDECSRILQDLTQGGQSSADDLLPLVYDELRALARAQLAKEPGHVSLDATMLVHEAWLRLVGTEDLGWNGRGHFFGAAARAMRRILVEQARRRQRLRHGGQHDRIDLTHAEAQLVDGDRKTVAMDEAIGELENRDPRKGKIVELRVFAGLSAEDTAKALGLSLRTVEREWRFIKSWLKVELQRD